MLLTDEEIYATWGEAKNEAYSFREFARAIESAVLEKLKAQESDKTKIECVTGAIYKYISEELYPREVIAAAQYIVHRYCTPPDDVVRDAERYRWLRDSGKSDDLIRGDCRGVYLPESAALDQAIDAATEKMK